MNKAGSRATVMAAANHASTLIPPFLPPFPGAASIER
jgi:hypothetical protein